MIQLVTVLMMFKTMEMIMMILTLSLNKVF